MKALLNLFGRFSHRPKTELEDLESYFAGSAAFDEPQPPSTEPTSTEIDYVGIATNLIDRYDRADGRTKAAIAWAIFQAGMMS